MSIHEGETVDVLHGELKKKWYSAMLNFFIRKKIKLPFDETLTDKQIDMVYPEMLRLFENYLKTVRKLPEGSEQHKIAKSLTKDVFGYFDPEVMQAYRDMKNYEQSVRLQNQHIKDGIRRKMVKEYNERIRKQFSEAKRKESMLSDAIMDMTIEKERLKEEKQRKIIEETKQKRIKKLNRKEVRKTIKKWNKYIRKEFETFA